MLVSRPEDSDRLTTPPPGSGSIPCTPVTDSPSFSSVHPEDSCDGDSDDGPEYLAIGNLGHRSRRDSRGSSPSSERDEVKEQYPQKSSVAPTAPRRSSFSEGQRGPGKSTLGHTRSFSDTGLNQKLRNGM